MYDGLPPSKLPVVWTTWFPSLALDDVGGNKKSNEQISLSHSAVAFLDLFGIFSCLGL